MKTINRLLYFFMAIFAIVSCKKDEMEPTVTEQTDGITPAAEISVQTVNITPAGNHTLKPGDELQLSATVLPENAIDRTVTWSSSSDGVATVDENGLVTAVTVGNATITATAGGISDSVDIIVEETYVPVTDIVHNVSNNSLTLVVGETFQIEAAVMPMNANAKTIDISVKAPPAYVQEKESIEVTKSGEVVARRPGFDTITLKVIGNGDAENPEYSEEILVEVIEMTTGWVMTNTGAVFNDRSSDFVLWITVADGVCTAAQYTCCTYEAWNSINEQFPDALIDATVSGRLTTAVVDLLKIAGCKEYFEGLTIAEVLERFGDDTSAILASWQDGLRATAFVTEGWSMPDIATIRYVKAYDGGNWAIDLGLNKLTGLVDSGMLAASGIDINLCDESLYYYVRDVCIRDELDWSYSFIADLVGYNQFLVQNYSEIEPLTYFDGHTLTQLIKKDVWGELSQKALRLL